MKSVLHLISGAAALPILPTALSCCSEVYHPFCYKQNDTIYYAF